MIAERRKLRESGRRVEVVAVAWDQALLDRAGRVLQSWVARDISEAEREVRTLRQAIAVLAGTEALCTVAARRRL